MFGWGLSLGPMSGGLLGEDDAGAQLCWLFGSASVRLTAAAFRDSITAYVRFRDSHWRPSRSNRIIVRGRDR